MNYETRLKKIRFRAWHRGIKEMDLMFGHFVDKNLQTLTPEEVDELEHLMSFPDLELNAWFTGKKVIPEELNTPIYQKMLTFEHLKHIAL